MINLVKSNFARNYNPKNQNDEGGATYEIKQMLNSRKLSDQYKAVNLLLETLTGYPDESVNRTKVCDYFLNSDICVFLANPLSNNDWNVQRDVIKCLKILSATRTFFVGNHAAIVTTSILRLLNHNVKNNKNDSAVDFCLYFLTDMIAGLSQVDQPPLISKGTVLNADQLFEFLLILPEHMAGNSNTNLITCLLLDGIVSMQTDKMDLNYKSVDLLSQVIKIWMPLFCNTMNDLANSIDVQNSVDSFYGILCHSGISCMRLCKYMREYDPNRNFVQKVITVEEDILRLRTCTETICKALFTTIKHLIEYTQENVDSIENENFESFLKFMFVSITEKANSNFQSKLLEIVVSHGFLEILPSAYGKRKNSAIAKLSYLNLSELLCLLSKQYLNIDDYPYGIQGFSRELQRGLKEVCHSPNGVKPKDMMKNGNYNGIIVYLYFYCLSIHNPQEVTSMYLPYLISFINHFPTNAGLPAYLVKCIWLLFSMASMSCSEYSSIEEKVQFFRALSGFVHLIRNDATEHYTHHPSILLWAFSFSRIPKDVKVATLSSWLSKEDTLPDALISESETRYLLVEILDKTKEKIIIVNSGNILKHCLENFLEGEDLDALSSSIWELLSGIYSQFLIDGDAAVLKLKCITELATKVMPFKVESDIYRKVAFLIIHVLCKFKTYTELNDEYVDVVTTTLILSIQIMHIANEDSDSTVLMSFANRQELLLKVLTAVIADDPKLSCTALEFLSTFVYFHATIQPYNKSVIRINIKNFMAFISHDEEKSKSVLRFVYTLLTSSSPYSIFSITSAVSDKDTVCVLKSVMFRLQMFCCQKNREQSAIGWKTLNCLLNYTRRLQGDDTSIISLALQPWTNTLIQFQLQQSPYCAEFLLFLKTWLIILKVLLKDKICFEVTDSNLSLLKCNAYFTTLSLLQTSLASTGKCDANKSLVGVLLGVIAEFFYCKDVE